MNFEENLGDFWVTKMSPKCHQGDKKVSPLGFFDDFWENLDVLFFEKLVKNRQKWQKGDKKCHPGDKKVTLLKTREPA